MASSDRHRCGIPKPASRPSASRDTTNLRFEQEDKMNSIKIVAVILILAGLMSLLYGGFSYTKETHEVKLGSLELSVNEKQTVDIPVWAGIAVIAIGGLLLAFGGRKG
jgi:hypothetical protein